MIILYGVLIGAAILSLCWAITAKAPAARANLFAGLDLPEPAPKDSPLGKIGRGLMRIVPTGYLQGLDNNLVQAAHPWKLDLNRLIGLKMALAVVPVLLGLAVGRPIFGLLAALILFLVPDFMVVNQRDARTAVIQEDAANTIDQLTICVEAGLGFDAALLRVASTTEGPLATELQRTVEDIQAGVPRDQALRSFAERTRLPDMKQLVSALIQAQKHGVTIAETLRIQSAELRDKRTQRIEEKAAKLATKILFPMVCCFLPVYFVIIIVPVAVEAFRALPS
jgi:tight adherence protein C